MFDSYKTIPFPPLEDFKVTEPSVHTLGNGLRVYLLEDHELPIVRVRAMLRVGTVYEEPSKVGLGSICAQAMRTGGTQTNPGDHLDDELGALAASVDVSMGATSGSVTAQCLSPRLPRVLEIVADLMRNPAFPENKIQLAKTALRTAISRRNDQIGSVAQRAFQIAMYGAGSPFSREPEYATVRAITRDDLLQFHARYFCAQRAAIGFVGSFDSAEVLEWTRRHLGDWNGPPPPLPDVPSDPLRISGRSVFFAEKSDVNQTNIYIGGVGVRRDDPCWPALRIGSFIFGSGGFSSRLMKKVRTELGLAYSVGGGFAAEYDRLGTFRAVCQTKTQSTGQALDAMLAEIGGLVEAPPTEAEVTLAKDQILNAEVFEYDSHPQILARRMTLDFYNYPPDFMEQTNRKIRQVTPDMVLDAVRQKLHPENLKVVAVGQRDGMDKPLADYGPVTVLDLSIPEDGK
jgi:predicted Zn-dependent peptidase